MDDGGRWQYILEKSQDALRYLERNGLSATIHKIENKLGGKSETSYDAWCQKYDVKKEELEEQRKKDIFLSAFVFRRRAAVSDKTGIFKRNDRIHTGTDLW